MNARIKKLITIEGKRTRTGRKLSALISALTLGKYALIFVLKVIFVNKKPEPHYRQSRGLRDLKRGLMAIPFVALYLIITEITTKPNTNNQPPPKAVEGLVCPEDKCTHPHTQDAPTDSTAPDTPLCILGVGASPLHPKHKAVFWSLHSTDTRQAFAVPGFARHRNTTQRHSTNKAARSAR